jgi:cytochrome c oxidase subunit 4
MSDSIVSSHPASGDPGAHADAPGIEAADGRVHAHIASWQFYAFILSILVVLTLLTVGISYIHLGKLNLMVAVAIATTKASLVVLFFMHLKYDNRFNAMILIVSLLFIGVFFAYTLNDTDRRAEVDVAQGARVLQSTGDKAPGGLEEHKTAEAAPGHEGAHEGAHEGTAEPAHPEHH